MPAAGLRAWYRIFALLNILAFLLVLLVHATAEILPLSGVTEYQARMRDDNLFLPAEPNRLFWLVQYLFLVVFVLYQSATFFMPPAATPSGGRAGERAGGPLKSVQFHQATSLFLPLAAILAVLSRLALHGDRPDRHFAATLGMLALLAWLDLRLEAYTPAIRAERWLIHVPFRLLFGWTLYNAFVAWSLLRTREGWNLLGVDPEIAAILLLLGLVLLTVARLVMRQDIAFAVAVEWGVAALAMRRVVEGTGNAPFLAAAAVLSMALLASGILVTTYRLLQVGGERALRGIRLS